MDESPEKKRILVPCLISDEMEGELKAKEKELDADAACVSIMYGFDKDKGSIGMFQKFLYTIAKAMLFGERGGHILMSYSQKVEQKKLGSVAAVNGILKWHTKGIQKPEEFEFLLVEHETTFSWFSRGDASTNHSFARHRGIKVMLKQAQGPVSKALFEILQELDGNFSLDLQSVHRCLLCRLCLNEGEHGFFPLEEGITMKSAHERCSRLKHQVDKDLVDMMEQCHEPEPFQLESLMDTDKESLELEPFCESSVKRKMLDGDLDEGTQIWIYHDIVTNPWNPVARSNPYAHVVVYVGSQKKKGETIHEVVHVAKNNWQGLVVAGISRVDVMSVIKTKDLVFLGHKIKACQFSGNVRKKIAARAIACAEKPKILFAYDHK